MICDKNHWFEKLHDFLIKNNYELISSQSVGIRLYYKELEEIIKLNNFNIELNIERFNSFVSFLCTKLPIYNNNYEALAFALERKFPETDLISVTNEEIRNMIPLLKNFVGNIEKADDDLIGAVLNVWVQIRFNEDFDDSCWDAMI